MGGRYQRCLVEACLKINKALQALLSMTYALIYNKDNIPAFTLPLAPNLPYDLLLPLFDSQVLDEQAYSRIFEACIGFPLGERALAARDDRHKALNIRPFDEKKKEPAKA